MSQISEKNLGFALALQEDASLPSSKRITLIEKDVPELKKGQGPCGTLPFRSDLDSFGDRESVINLDTKISNRAPDLGVT